MITFDIIALTPYAHERILRRAQTPAARRVRDGRGNTIEIGAPGADDRDALLGLHAAAEGSARAAGLPLGDAQQGAWLDRQLDGGANIVARSAGRVIGHAAIRAGEPLALFVHRDFRGIGLEEILADAVHEAAGLPPARPRPTIVAAARARLQGLVGALRFAWIPIFCATIIAIASEHPRGRGLAIALAIASLAIGLVAHAREIVFGRYRNVPGLTS